MNEYLEFDKDTKALKSINLDDYSVSDLNDYIMELNKEIERVKFEIDKKNKLQKEAEKIFK
tara:strand:+ start:279 stop:461 length:183 start_codon:yes stop_codon:yes gene_type:complete